MPTTEHPVLYLVVFTILSALAHLIALGRRFAEWKWALATAEAGRDLGGLQVVALGVTYIAVQGGIMLAELFTKGKYKKGKEEGRQEGRQEAEQEAQAQFVKWRDQYRAWSSRREDAVLEGQTFDEPEPSAA